MRRPITKLDPKEGVMMKWNTQTGIITINIIVRIYFTLLNLAQRKPCRGVVMCINMQRADTI